MDSRRGLASCLVKKAGSSHLCQGPLMRMYKTGPLSLQQIAQMSGVVFVLLLLVFWLVSGDFGTGVLVAAGGAAGGAVGRLIQRRRGHDRDARSLQDE